MITMYQNPETPTLTLHNESVLYDIYKTIRDERIETKVNTDFPSFFYNFVMEHTRNKYLLESHILNDPDLEIKVILNEPDIEIKILPIFHYLKFII